MSDVEITIRLPEALVKRAKAAGVEIEAQQIIAVLEQEIRRAEAGRSVLTLMDKIDALPDNVKPTPEEIEAEIRAYRAEKAVRAGNDKA
jgi:hypothetical protein